MGEKINIYNEDFEVLDQLENIPIVDSFVKYNKIGVGAGEARLYVGTQSGIDFAKFFNDFTDKCFFLKRDFEDYLNDAKFEYEVQEQGYQKNITEDWQKYVSRIKSFDEKTFFFIESALGEQDASRYYIRAKTQSKEDIFYGYFREIALPVITYLSIMKLKDKDNNIFFYFRPFLNYYYRPEYHPTRIKREEEEVKKDTRLTEGKKEQIVKARRGQGEYRKQLLEETTECIITKVNDERLLIASHIKPWAISTDEERVDHYNGLILTPTYDKLFDQGFISFEDDGTILISPYISPLNIKKLNLAPGRKYDIPQHNKRNIYLEHHRKNIFK